MYESSAIRSSISMLINDRPSTSIRRAAFGKLAILSAKYPTSDGGISDFDRLRNACRRSNTSPTGYLDGVLKGRASPAPIKFQDIDVLFSLCEASGLIHRAEDVAKLVSLLADYLPDCSFPILTSSPLLHSFEVPPWELLTYKIVTALLSLGSRYHSHHDQILDKIFAYIENCIRLANNFIGVRGQSERSDYHRDLRDLAEIATLAVSLVGFFDGLSKYTNFFTSSERLRLMKRAQAIFSEQFLVAIESTSSTIRNLDVPDFHFHQWRRYARLSADAKKPLSSMLLQAAFFTFVKTCTSSADKEIQPSTEGYHSKQSKLGIEDSEDLVDLVTYAASIAADQIQLLDEGLDYLQLGAPWQQHLAFTAKAHALATIINCVIVDEDSVDIDILLPWLDSTILDGDQMANEELATVTFRAIVVLSERSRPNAPSLTRSLLRFIVQNKPSSTILPIAANSLAKNLHLLSQDTVIGILYSLGNVLSASPSTDKVQPCIGMPTEETNHLIRASPQQPNGSFVFPDLDGEEDNYVIYKNVVLAIITAATSSGDNKIIALAQSMLLQKIGRVNVLLDACIIQETAALALKSETSEFQVLLKFYSRLYRDAAAQGNMVVVDAVSKARNFLATCLPKDNHLFKIYLTSLLEGIVNKGGATDREKDRASEIELSESDISPYLQPVATLLSKVDVNEFIPGGVQENGDILSLLRDTWFNIAAHGVTLHSEFKSEYHAELCAIAEHSPPLVSENRSELLEGDIELNTILRRGMNPLHSTKLKRNLAQEFPSLEHEIKRLSYSKLVFLNATLLLESLRASSGDFTKVLIYSLDPALNNPDIINCMKAIVDRIVMLYLEKISFNNSSKFSAYYVSRQLADTFIACCHRVERVQNVAIAAAEKLISRFPSSLCEKKPLFTLLDLLTLLWASCLDEELDEYEWKSTFTSAAHRVTIELSDNYDFRKHTLNKMYTFAKSWVTATMSIAPLDVKGLLQTYLSDYEDDGGYGHTSMGRSFALEMGSTIPSSDQRLASIERSGNTLLNVASDFIAQYTTRQEYRFSEAKLNNRRSFDRALVTLGADGINNEIDLPDSEDIQQALIQIESHISRHKKVPQDMLRSILRKAAAVLCNSDDCEPSLIFHLVNIPFQLFNKESIKMGISLWLGVINENPEAQPRIIVEVAQAWERTIRRKRGIFDSNFKFVDPFMTQIESLPSDKDAIMKYQRKVQNIISPHLRLLHFLESHFNATRLAGSHIQKIFRRLIGTTLDAFRHTAGHPLCREFHFHTILFSLKVLRYTTGQSKIAVWKLKDQILSAALSWFSHKPRWSFGANRLQMKAEDQILRDIESALAANSWNELKEFPSRRSLKAKQELLLLLIDNERSRLKVWMSPIDSEKRHHSGNKISESTITGFLRLSWTENPNLAINLMSRFPSPKLSADIRWKIFNFPEKVLDDPDSLEVLLGSSLPQDVTFQLKYLLYWKPTNPIAAVTYFLPDYGNHPFIIQYAMRVLESHSVDVSFFYIPQLVQALRYDALGYVGRYLLETAQISPYFAHQVIWNMKANAYKDDDSQIPDPVKPVLDKFMGELITGFSEEDRNFYEREFSFFNEITDVSGKLRPYIKRSKPEKKEKIEEELRKIKLEVGVYLPSNPDGIVVGIDRKSGKPLQSHAKAPYMATFRIQKTRAVVDENGNGQKEGDLSAQPNGQQSTLTPVDPLESTARYTYEVWQSAIFKVGDDCRQDMLALQMIAAFRSIFANVGLDVFVYPYRVVATAPGCGVIDVLPNSISRDMLGREAVNGLYDYFVSKYGGEDSIRFQEARSNFVKSMAAYSVISYLLQFKDRHNGNIMIDDAGHIIHIDFGFCFDIAPGGIRFERAPFKLTSEMVAVMGGRVPPHHHQSPTDNSGISFPAMSSHNPLHSQSYRWFEALVIKAFLASRPYHAKLAHIVTLMLDSGLPCFKTDTLKHFRERFALEKNEAEAAQHMRELIRKSYASISTVGYDHFQLWTNSIPY